MSPHEQLARTLDDAQHRARVLAEQPDYHAPAGVVVLVVALVALALAGAGIVGASLALGYAR